MTALFDLLDTHPRRIYGLTALVAVLLLAFGLYLQHVDGLVPCPMCIVQRYAFVLVALLAAVAATRSSPRAWVGCGTGSGAKANGVGAKLGRTGSVGGGGGGGLI
jgi:disulfide bond formation protein DsbB